LIEPEGTGAELRYRVRLSVRDDWQIPEDSLANIVSSSLISAMIIEIDAGASSKVLAAGGTLRSNEQSNLFAALGRAADDFGDLSRSGLRPLLENLDRRTGQLTDEYVALRRDNLAPFIDSMRADAKQLLSKVDDGATRLQRLLSDDNQQMLEQTLRNVTDATGTLDQLVNDVQQTNVELRNTMTELNRLVVDNRPGVTAAVSDLQKVLEGLRAATDNLEGRIDGILYHLEGSTRNADEFARRIRENPGSLLRSNPPREEGVAP
jgi:phospholipid/cholesterol/gamma-HCH transport system substrate-binding protein